MSKNCDNMSVGVIIQNSEGKIALLKRARFPVGIAPPAGHVDDHGSPKQAALDEVREELGLIIAPDNLRPTGIQERKVNNQCRRPGGDHHVWWVYEANEFSGELVPDPEETKGADWYDATQLQSLADRTKAFRAGSVPADEWGANPGLEEIWLDFLVELGYVS